MEVSWQRIKGKILGFQWVEQMLVTAGGDWGGESAPTGALSQSSMSDEALLLLMQS